MPTQFVNGKSIRLAVRPTKAYREVLLSVEQLIDPPPAGGIAPAGVFYLVGQPTANDTIVLKHNTVTETYTFVASASSPFEVTIGADVDETMANFAAAITADSTEWSAKRVTSLESINDGSGNSTAGYAVIIWRQVPVNGGGDRIYGVLSTQAFGQYVDFGGEADYAVTTSETLPAIDPGRENFGVGRAQGDLSPGERHWVLAEDQTWVWEADAGRWRNAAGENVPIVIRAYAVGVAVRDLVYQSASGTVDKASANSLATARPLGFVRRLDEPDPGLCEVQLGGDVDGFTGLTPGKVYIMSKAAGQIIAEDDTTNPNYPSAAGEIIQEVGIANTPTTLLVQALRDFEEI